MNVFAHKLKLLICVITLSGLYLIPSELIASGPSRIWDAIDSQKKVELPAKMPDDIYHNSKVRVEGTDIFTNIRTPHMERFPCTNCHTKSLKVTQEVKGQMRKTHWELEVVHPKENLECSTCHLAENGQLKMISGKAVELDESYLVCGQCHGVVLKDWKGGAHGKRLTGWGKERVIENCTGCHNPHSPKFKTKRPEINVTYPQK